MIEQDWTEQQQDTEDFKMLAEFLKREKNNSTYQDACDLMTDVFYEHGMTTQAEIKAEASKMIMMVMPPDFSISTEDVERLLDDASRWAYDHLVEQADMRDVGIPF